MAKAKLLNAIQSVNSQGDKAFVAYIMAGDDGLETLKSKILFLQAAGVTAIELGIPFSDPVADGPTIQQAGERALANGTTLRLIMQEIETFYKEVSVPLVLMTYYNPLLSYGLEQFAQACDKLGIAGLIVPDLPVEETVELHKVLADTDVALVPLVSLTSPPERIAKITSSGEGFIYAVTVNGITGVRDGFGKQLEQHFTNLLEQSNIPVLAGFGISTPEQVKSMGALADGVIVGSAIVDAFHQNELEKITALIQAAKMKVVN
ncbi:tryptophan synthase subunit alpha [Psychrobacillus sp. INOP01]|uniref:tryptophan synthase subunit alpha n=1 Tax=Psychrobacillus sp. INOP01 TaxID=2829187 RepID=UPI001BAD4AB8|nr:tryptophan synthase subunit alpha [Psychrobacillus sp. INOP01]QUG41632.1 tryptophan synthase subunit alpha [Psychrobacillus sp. INOP01]